MKKKKNEKTSGKEKMTEVPEVVMSGQSGQEVIQNILLSDIRVSGFNPRKYRSEEDLNELRQSIVNFGIIQPVTLRRKADLYEIVCGERRYRASLMAGLATIPAIIKDYSDEEAMEISILENLQRRDINPVEEALSFGKLMEVRRYSIDDLVKQFGKTDKYIRSRLQLRNLIDPVSELLAKDEITLSVALELSRFCPDIQQEVYREHLTDDNYSWKNLPVKDFRRMLETGYSSDLSKYEFDKSDCTTCQFNSSVYDLFMDGDCGSCQNLDCLRNKQAQFIARETTKLLEERKNLNVGICVAPNSFASAEVVNNLSETGLEIYEMNATPMPVKPKKPLQDDFTSDEEFRKAEHCYTLSLERHNIHVEQIEAMVQEGKAQMMVNVSNRTPELCYHIIPETNQKLQTGETVEELQRKDRRNREIAFENGVEDIKHLVRGSLIPEKEFTPLEEELLYFIMLSFLRVENFSNFGFNTQFQPADDEKASVIATLTGCVGKIFNYKITSDNVFLLIGKSGYYTCFFIISRLKLSLETEI
jgi:ParB family chromosome partitioning protein